MSKYLEGKFVVPDAEWTYVSKAGAEPLQSSWDTHREEHGTILVDDADHVELTSRGINWDVRLTGHLNEAGHLEDKKFELNKGDARAMQPISRDGQKTYRVDMPGGFLTYGTNGVQQSYSFRGSESRMLHVPIVAAVNGGVRFADEIKRARPIAHKDNIYGLIELDADREGGFDLYVPGLLQSSIETVWEEDGRLEFVSRPSMGNGTRTPHPDLKSRDPLSWTTYTGAKFIRYELWPLHDDNAYDAVEDFDLDGVQSWVRELTLPLLTRKYTVTATAPNELLFDAEYFRRQNANLLQMAMKWRFQHTQETRVLGSIPDATEADISIEGAVDLHGYAMNRHLRNWGDSWQINDTKPEIHVSQEPPQAWQKSNPLSAMLNMELVCRPTESGLVVGQTEFIAGNHVAVRHWEPTLMRVKNAEKGDEVFELSVAVKDTAGG